MLVAIDGPAGAGKSSIAKLISKKLNLEYIDSGAIYRAITKKILDSGIKIDDHASIKIWLNSFSIELIEGDVFLKGENYAAFLREKEVSKSVSVISALEEVREKVNCFLNEYSLNKSIIMDGRDIGSVVFPHADYKFYLDASVEERAHRRIKELQYASSLEEVKEAIASRDYNDEHRKVGALKRMPDAIYIDTTGMSIDEVVDKILICIK